MDPIEELLTRGVEAIYPTREALEKVLRSGKKLRLYQGFDPTGKQLHIGHMVGLMKLRHFQKLGHHVIFLIGDFTGMIGDPTGKSESRKPLTRDEVLANSKFYKEQTYKILEFGGTNPVQIKYNYDWLSKITTPQFIRLISNFTYQQIIERDMYQERKKRGQDIAVSEFLYPVLQGYDSVELDVDLEIGGTDQMFNMMVGRELMHKMKRKEKYVMTIPLLTDSSGKKIGKTEGNVIALTAAPNDFYGMIMSLPDDIIVKCFELITDVSMSEVEAVKNALEKGENPMEYKKKLAFTLTGMLNDQQSAQNAQQNFEHTFQRRDTTSVANEIKLKNKTTTTLYLVAASGLVKSNAEARRLITQGAIDYNGQKLTDPTTSITIVNGAVLKVGKHRFVKTINK